jgi:hypothetical protein
MAQASARYVAHQGTGNVAHQGTGNVARRGTGTWPKLGTCISEEHQGDHKCLARRPLDRDQPASL